MIRKPRRPRILAEINITPFTDVILVLLIIFMIATPLIFQSNIQIKLPKTTTAQPIMQKDQVYITISAESIVYWDNQIVTKKELKMKMTAMRNKNPDINVLLRVDQIVRFKDVVEVLDILNELGVHNFNIATLPK